VVEPQTCRTIYKEILGLTFSVICQKLSDIPKTWANLDHAYKANILKWSWSAILDQNFNEKDDEKRLFINKDELCLTFKKILEFLKLFSVFLFAVLFMPC
jgi:hypothetical protein